MSGTRSAASELTISLFDLDYSQLNFSLDSQGDVYIQEIASGTTVLNINSTTGNKDFINLVAKQISASAYWSLNVGQLISAMGACGTTSQTANNGTITTSSGDALLMQAKKTDLGHTVTPAFSAL